MTLAETCDRIEALLEIVEMTLCKAYLRTLVELGELLSSDEVPFQDGETVAQYDAAYNRFEALKARVLEAVGK